MNIVKLFFSGLLFVGVYACGSSMEEGMMESGESLDAVNIYTDYYNLREEIKMVKQHASSLQKIFDLNLTEMYTKNRKLDDENQRLLKKLEEKQKTCSQNHNYCKYRKPFFRREKSFENKAKENTKKFFSSFASSIKSEDESFHNVDDRSIIDILVELIGDKQRENDTKHLRHRESLQKLRMEVTNLKRKISNYGMCNRRRIYTKENQTNSKEIVELRKKIEVKEKRNSSLRKSVESLKKQYEKDMINLRTRFKFIENKLSQQGNKNNFNRTLPVINSEKRTLPGRSSEERNICKQNNSELLVDSKHSSEITRASEIKTLGKPTNGYKGYIIKRYLSTVASTNIRNVGKKKVNNYRCGG